MVPEKSLSVTAILSGPTGAGKSEIALEIARRARARGLALEIINADSLLVYRHMDVGTAKPLPDERKEIPHHLIDVREPSENFTAGDFSKAVLETLETLERERKRALIVGGSGFYLKALLYGLWEAAPSDPAVRAELDAIESRKLYDELYEKDPEAALRIGANDRYRLVRAHELMRLTGKTPSLLQSKMSQAPDPRLRLLVIDRPSEELYARVAQRTRAMLGRGLLEEVRWLRERFAGARALGAVGYAQAARYLDGLAPQGRKAPPGLEGLASEIDLATRQLIKRQRTWFRGEENAERFELERDRARLRERLEDIYR